MNDVYYYCRNKPLSDWTSNKGWRPDIIPCLMCNLKGVLDWLFEVYENLFMKTCWKSRCLTTTTLILKIALDQVASTCWWHRCLSQFPQLSLLITQLLYIFFQNRLAVIIYLKFWTFRASFVWFCDTYFF